MMIYVGSVEVTVMDNLRECNCDVSVQTSDAVPNNDGGCGESSFDAVGSCTYLATDTRGALNSQACTNRAILQCTGG